MLNDDIQRREQAVRLVATFCKKPYREHGKKRDSGTYKGWHLHDWGHLVQRVYRTFYDQTLSIADATIAAKLVRKEFPNQPDWNERVGAQNAQARILSLIEAESRLLRLLVSPASRQVITLTGRPRWANVKNISKV